MAGDPVRGHGSGPGRRSYPLRPCAGGSRRSSIRSTHGRFRTRTVTASGISAVSRSGSVTARGAAWSRDEQTGRWYLHSFYPEQPDLDWRNHEVVAAMQDVVRFWLERGVDGFRLDAIDKLIKDDRLRNDPPATATFPLPLRGEAATLEHVYSAHRPEAIAALAAIRSVAGDALLVGEVFQPTSAYPPYLEVLDLVFAFEFLFAPWDAERLRAAIAPAAELRRVAWVLSNHDFDR